MTANAPARRAATPPTSSLKPDNIKTPPATHVSRVPGTALIDPEEVDVRLVDDWGPGRSLRRGVLPWKRAGALTFVAAEDPVVAEQSRKALEALFGPVAIAATNRHAIETSVLRARQGALVGRAEHRSPAALSSRHFGGQRARMFLAASALTIAILVLLSPVTVFAALIFWASFWLFVSTCLRLAATIAAGRSHPKPKPAPQDLPKISLLVPLFRERDITNRLIERLARLTYPTDKLEVLLIAEKHDPITRAALDAANLPGHMRQIVVPPGTLCTKPRAMNYALDFCRGDIIGVYDAEDAPAPDQLKVVAAEFAAAPRDVACLQGRLDFYNPKANWLARCFTIDYATWFRTVLPGIARLGLPVPLGGTTLFFRRDILEKLGAWDAHNVTEDADLGIRLARHGWRTQLIATTTDEEANCRVWPWIKQRSRWIKGYAVTWAVHMKHPIRLWSDLGPRKFIGFQVIFLGSLSQVALAPFLWSFWLILLGAPHPLSTALPEGVLLGLAALFLGAEVTNIAVNAWSCRSDKHRWLIAWVPTMHFYHPLAAVASWKGLSEIARRPFFWDKTDHGISPDPEANASAS